VSGYRPPWLPKKVTDKPIPPNPHLAIGIFAPPDVRPILKAYQGKDIPVEYAKREAERKQAAIEEWEKEHGTGVVAASGASWLSRAFGSLGGVSTSWKARRSIGDCGGRG
jgi:hypothetical protein